MAAAAEPVFSILSESPYGTQNYAGAPGSGVYFSGPSWQIGYSGASFLPPFSAATGASLSPANIPLPLGVEVGADCTYSFNCRFVDDQEDFEQFMSGLWKIERLKFRSVKA